MYHTSCLLCSRTSEPAVGAATLSSGTFGAAQAQGFASVAHLVADRLGRPMPLGAVGCPAAEPAAPTPVHAPGCTHGGCTPQTAAGALAGPADGAAASTAAAAVGGLARVAKAAVGAFGRAAGVRKRGSCAGDEENVRVTRLRSGFAGLAT